MLGTVAFIAFWVLLGLLLLYVAMRGGPRAASESLYGDSRRGRRFAALFFVVSYVVVGVAVPVAMTADVTGRREVPGSGVKLNKSQETGRALFADRCGNCHTLAAAKTVGRIGPNLDKLKPNKTLTLGAILEGRVRGSGTMPAQLYDGREAEEVASFVAAVAGK